jgi:hypothetical protein
VLFLASCAWDAGSPWGEIETALEVVFDPDATRLTPDGLLLTSASYGVAIESLSIRIESVTVQLEGGGDVPADFDPANPPEGFSNCHGGHCHAADGSLVPYAQVAAIGAGGSATEAPLVVQAPTEPWVALVGAREDVPLEPCAGGCTTGRGDLDVVQVAVSRVELAGRVFDRLGEGDVRLPAAGIPVVFEVPVTATLSHALSGRFGKDEPAGLALSVALEVPGALLDGIDWPLELGAADPDGAPVDLSASLSVAVAIESNLLTRGELQVDSRRYDP